MFYCKILLNGWHLNDPGLMRAKDWISYSLKIIRNNFISSEVCLDSVLLALVLTARYLGICKIFTIGLMNKKLGPFRFLQHKLIIVCNLLSSLGWKSTWSEALSQWWDWLRILALAKFRVEDQFIILRWRCRGLALQPSSAQHGSLSVCSVCWQISSIFWCCCWCALSANRISSKSHQRDNSGNPKVTDNFFPTWPKQNSLVWQLLSSIMATFGNKFGNFWQQVWQLLAARLATFASFLQRISNHCGQISIRVVSCF